MMKYLVTLAMIMALSTAALPKYQGGLAMKMCSATLTNLIQLNNLQSQFPITRIVTCDMQMAQGYMFNIQIEQPDGVCSIDLRLGVDGYPRVLFKGENYCQQLKLLLGVSEANLPSVGGSSILSYLALASLPPKLIEQAKLTDMGQVAKSVLTLEIAKIGAAILDESQLPPFMQSIIAQLTAAMNSIQNAQNEQIGALTNWYASLLAELSVITTNGESIKLSQMPIIVQVLIGAIGLAIPQGAAVDPSTLPSWLLMLIQGIAAKMPTIAAANVSELPTWLQAVIQGVISGLSGGQVGGSDLHTP